MPVPLAPSRREVGPASLLNAVFIGYMVGTYSVIGKGGAQAVANMAGEYVGREIVAFAESQGQHFSSLPNLASFLTEQGLAGVISFREGESELAVEISACGICPKRIGKYQFDGTACPWGGILIGALEAVLDRRFSVSTRLVPGTTCAITLHPK
jgi:hypothetical protein